MVGRPALEYGSEVCAQFLPRELEAYQRWTARRALGAPRNALGVAAVGDMGWPALQTRHEQAMLRFWGRILDMPHDRLPRCVYEALREENHRNSWSSKVRATALAWGLYEVWENQRLPPVEPPSQMSEGDAWKEMLRGLAKRMARAEWRDSSCHDPQGSIASNYANWLHVPEGAPSMQMAEYLGEASVEDRGAQILFSLRSGTSVLRVDADRMFGIPHSQRLCTFCECGSVEDARHVLMECPAHEQARRSLLTKLPSQLCSWDEEGIFNALMGSEGLARLCPRAAVRFAALGAIKAFWVAALKLRDELLQI